MIDKYDCVEISIKPGDESFKKLECEAGGIFKKWISSYLHLSF